MIRERTIEKFTDKYQWIKCKLEDLERGDVFRMFEPDGSPVHGDHEFAEMTVFQALEDACRINDKWTVVSKGIN